MSVEAGLAVLAIVIGLVGAARTRPSVRWGSSARLRQSGTGR